MSLVALALPVILGAGWLSTAYALIQPMPAAYKARFMGRVVKTAVGVIAWTYMSQSIPIMITTAAADQEWNGVGLLVWALPVWCVVTGATKILLLMKGDPSCRNAPAVFQNPHGVSRRAGPGEGRRAMQGQGNRSRMGWAGVLSNAC